MTTPEDVRGFWFGEATPVQWFAKDDGFDVALRSRFGALHDEAAAGGLGDWATTADGRMALVLVLDQMSRNLYRGAPRAFAQDGRAREVARRGLALGDPAFAPPQSSEERRVGKGCVRTCGSRGAAYS